MHTIDTSSPTVKMKKYRAKLRAAGLRPVQIWVPDARLPRLAREVKRQSLLASRHSDKQDILAFIESAADLDDWK